MGSLRTPLVRACIETLRGDEWVIARRSYLQCGDVRFDRNRFTRADGSTGSVHSPRTVMQGWADLRSAMARAEAGAWLSADLDLATTVLRDTGASERLLLLARARRADDAVPTGSATRSPTSLLEVLVRMVADSATS